MMFCVAARELQYKDIKCLGHLQRVFDLLERLHEVGCERDSAGNRQLHFDGYCKLVLLHIWNPLLESIPDLQRALGLPQVAKTLGVRRFSAGSFSESVRVFEPDLLRPIIEELAGQLPTFPRDKRLDDLEHVLTLVDGTVLPAIARLARSVCGDGLDGLPDTRYNTARDGRGMHGWRLHTQFDLKTFSPRRIDRTGARNAGASRESRVLRANLEPGRCYVGDGGYADRKLFDDITDIGSSYVIRAADNAVFEVVEERLLSQEALDAGIVRDVLVRLEGAKHLTRRIEVQVEPHLRRFREGNKQIDLIALTTNLDPALGCQHLAAELIALIYLKRYTIELFFRCFKQLLGMRHLLSQRQEGIDIQIYCTVIVCLLIQIISGKKPNKATRSMVGFYLMGWASEEDVLNELNKPDNRGVKLRAKEELWKKLGY
jgi:DDE family transposase